MNTLQNFRSLLSTQTDGISTGSVLAISDSGAVSVLAGARVITCFASIPIRVHDKVRVQGRAVLSVVPTPTHEPLVYRV